MKYLNFLIIAIFSLQSFSTELSIGLIEEIYLKSGTNERRVQEDDSWNGKAWNIDETFKDLKIQKENLNLVIIAIDSAKRINGNILDETRRYAEYFPKESIRYIDESFKRSIYSNFIDSQKFNYQDFVINKVIPAIETKFNIRLNKDNLGIIGASILALLFQNDILQSLNESNYISIIQSIFTRY